MASAAAVAADAARSPLGSEEDEVNGIKSKITGNDEEVANDLFGEDEDVDDDVRTGARNRKRSAYNTDGMNGEELDPDEDLFGEDDGQPTRRRHLDDQELDSGDDEDRDDRVEDGEADQEVVAQERTVQDVDLPRLPIPQPSDGEMYLLKVPKFLSIDAKKFSTDDFRAPTSDHHQDSAGSNFSAYNTALTTLRWRRSPSKPSELQSNARINRWSDGSLTLQFASNPQVQYEINGNALAPPQRNPVKPTPTSIHSGNDKAGRRGVNSQPVQHEKYDPSKHAFTYLVMPLPGQGLIRVTNAITAGLTVSPPADFIDEAIVNLQSDLAAASGVKQVNGATTVGWTETTEDPELAKKRAEQAEREKMRARKKQDAQIERERERSDRALGRHGLASSRFGGLSAGMLEDDDGLATTRGRTAARPKPRRQRRANSEYSSEEDYGRRAFQVSKEDDYDVEDDFVAASDEEEEVPEDEEEDEDEGIIEEGRAARQKASPKRPRDDEDAEGEDDGGEDTTAATGVERKRKRIVVADDDEDE